MSSKGLRARIYKELSQCNDFKKRKHWAGGVTSVVLECLPSKYKAVSSALSTTKTQQVWGCIYLSGRIYLACTKSWVQSQVREKLKKTTPTKK
jgi:hypothetical protein